MGRYHPQVMPMHLIVLVPSTQTPAELPALNRASHDDQSPRPMGSMCLLVLPSVGAQCMLSACCWWAVRGQLRGTRAIWQKPRQQGLAIPCAHRGLLNTASGSLLKPHL